MSRKLRLLAIVLLLIAVVPLSGIQQGTEPMVWPERDGLIVMSFNIRTSMAFDGLDSWLFRRTMVVDVIKEVAPDIIMIQEATPMQLSYLKSKVLGYRVATAGIGKQWRGYPVIFFREDRFRVQVNTTERLWFSNAPKLTESVSWGNRIPRCYTSLTLWDEFQSQPIAVASTHLDHESSESRKESVRMLASWVHNNNGNLVILGGDFNESADSSTFNVLRSNSVESARNFDLLRDCIEESDKPIGTFHGFTGSGGPRIDMIFASPEWKVSGGQIIKYSRSGRYPSDHYPVVTTLEYPFPPLMMADSSPH